MRAAVYRSPHTIAVDEVPDPRIELPTDVVVEVEAAGVCGSDLWTYRGQGTAAPGARIGHEFVGTVVAAGSDVTSVSVGDWVIVPFRYNCGRCHWCRQGWPTSCVDGGFWSRDVVDGGQGELVRVPLADGTVVRALPHGERPPVDAVADYLALSDVMPTGYHAALRAGVTAATTTVAVVGDGAVGQCAVAACCLLGAQQVILVGSRHPNRRALAAQMGATTVLAERGPAAVQAIRELTDGAGAQVVLECVGTGESFDLAVDMISPAGTISYVGLPHGVQLDPARLFARNVTITGGMAPARAYIPELLAAVQAGTVSPGAVFTDVYALADIARAYDDLDRRVTVKPLVTMGAASAE